MLRYAFEVIVAVGMIFILIEEEVLMATSKVAEERGILGVLPLRRRKIDFAIVVFFLVNILFITYIVT